MIDTATHPYFGAASTRGERMLAWLRGSSAECRAPLAGSRSPSTTLDAGPGGPVVCLYDGSAGARRAIEHAAELFGGSRALVVCLWEPSEAALLARTAAPAALGGVGRLADELDAAARARAERMASEGAALASEHGFSAQALAIAARDPLWRAVVALAEHRGARAVVLGARGRSCATALVAGSLSHAAIHRCPCPVLVVGPEAGAPVRVEDRRHLDTGLELAEAAA